jgi:uncharacterized protein HemY
MRTILFLAAVLLTVAIGCQTQPKIQQGNVWLKMPHIVHGDKETGTNALP